MRQLKTDVACLVVVAAAFSNGVSAQEMDQSAELGTAPVAEASTAPLSLSIQDTPSEELPATLPVPEALPAVPNARTDSKSRLVEEIIVTAQKRAENAQDVPITIQAFSAAKLDALGVQNTQDLALVTPSLNFGEFVGYSIIFMRGVGTNAFLTADPSIATYVDGVYLPFSFGQTADFGSIERVEVLKGPQGTIFGRNAVGGAISVYTKDPSTDAATLDLSTSYSRFNDTIVKGTANLPVTDTFAVSVSGNYHRNDFYYHGRYGTDTGQEYAPNGRSYGPELGRGVRVKAMWTPSEQFDVMGAYAYNDFNGYSTSVTPNIDPSPLTKLLAAAVPGDANIPGNYEANLNEAGLGYFSRLAYGRINYRPGPVDIKLSGSHQYTGNYQFYDFDGTSARIAEFDSAQGDGSGVKATTAELQLTSNRDTPFSRVFDWVAGAYYFDSQAGFRKPATLYLNVVDPVTNLLGKLTQLGATLDQLTGLNTLENLIGQSPTGRIGFSSGVGTTSYSGYAQGSIHFTDWLALTLGGRYQSEKRDANESGTWLEKTNGDFLKIINRRPQSATTNSFSPKISIELHPTDNILTYISYQTATKSGTYNTVNIYDTIDYVKPEKITAYEVGAKTTLFGTLQLNGAVWYYEQKNLQTQFVSLLKGGAVTFQTAGAAKSKGVEFDANWLAFPNLVDDFVVIASGAYVDATYSSYPNASGFDETTGILRNNYDFTGNRVPQAPKFTGTVQLNKTFQIDRLSSALEVGTDFYYNSGFFWTSQNSSDSKQGNYQTLGAHLSWLYQPTNVRVTVFGSNLTNQRYNKQEFTADFGTVRFQAAPVEYGMRLELSF